jgi:hypothetical protein
LRSKLKNKWQIVIRLLNATVFKILLTLFRDVHKFDSDLLLRVFVCGRVDLAETTFTDDFSDFVFVKNSAIVEFFAVQRNVKDVSVLDKLHIFI